MIIEARILLLASAIVIAGCAPEHTSPHVIVAPAKCQPELDPPDIAAINAACKREMGLPCDGLQHVSGPINAQMKNEPRACINNQMNYIRNGAWEVQAPVPEYCVALSI